MDRKAKSMIEWETKGKMEWTVWNRVNAEVWDQVGRIAAVQVFSQIDRISKGVRRAAGIELLVKRKDELNSKHNQV